MVRIRIHGLTFFRAVLFLPQVIATVSVALAWLEIYSFDGPINALLEFVHLDGLTRTWLGDYQWALPALGLIGTWFTFGFCLVLFLAGAQRIPRDLYDAARVDGAGAIAEFRAITLPGLRRQVLFALIITVIAVAPHLRRQLPADAGRPGPLDGRPVVRDLSPGLRPRQRRAGRRIRCRPDGNHPPLRAAVDAAGGRPGGGMRGTRRDRVVNHAFLLAFAFLALYPILRMLVVAVAPANSTPSGASLIPGSVELHNFSRVWTAGDFSSALVTSGLIAVVVVGGATVLSILAGFAFAFLPVPAAAPSSCSSSSG